MKYFLSCKKAAELCDKAQYSEAGPFAKLLLRIHVFICKPCKGYTKQNTKLTETLQSAKLQALAPEKKEFLRNQIQTEVQKQQSL